MDWAGSNGKIVILGKVGWSILERVEIVLCGVAMRHCSPVRPASRLLELALLLVAWHGRAQEAPAPSPSAPAGIAFTAPPVDAGMRPLPINLPTALQLAGTNPLDGAAASERLRLAAAQLREAKTLWLPNLQVGADYFRHDGQIQDVQGHVFDY